MWTANNMNLPLSSSSSCTWSRKKRGGGPLLSSLTTTHHSTSSKAITIEKFAISRYYSSCFYCFCSSNKDGTRNQLLRFDLLDSQRPSSLRFSVRCSLNQGASPESLPQHQPSQREGFWRKWKANSGEMRSKLAKLGLAAVLAYGIIDGITYTTFFVLAFLGFEKSTGKNPAANLQALLGIVILMWTGNNVTRPFRVAGAAALAPLVDRGLKKIQNYFKFPRLVYAFAFVVSIVAVLCFTVAGSLILSRWGK